MAAWPAHGPLVLVIAVAAALPTPARAQPLEPPPEAVAGDDYAVDVADSLDSGAVEVGLGAARSGQGPLTRTRRVRLRGEGLDALLRDGAGDPLRGTWLSGPTAGGEVRVGRIAPRWGRGLVFGAAAEPWSLAADDRGARSAYRGRSGDGGWYRRPVGRGAGLSVELLAGRFSRRDLGGLRLGLGHAAVGLAAGRRGGRQWSAGLEGERSAAEVAFDEAGRWRAELALDRAAGAWQVAARVRGGSDAFRPLAEPARAGPARAVAVHAAGRAGAASLVAGGALWRFAPGLAGARGWLEVGVPMGHHGGAAVGFEEQHGVRRIPASAPSPVPAAPRQGLWGEWRATSPMLALQLRLEAWGEGRFDRGALRRVSSVRVEAPLPAGSRLAVGYALYRARRGESLYLADAEGDRLVLRSLSGAGERTRLELASPAAGGTVRAALNLSPAPRPKTQWTLEWTRRARVRASP